jgi:hypothetical protein
MVDDQLGSRGSQPRELPLWTKLFNGFKVALDPKKLLLAAAGIFVMSAGWYVLSVAFWSVSGKKPEWSDFKSNLASYPGETEAEQNENAWRDFKQTRRRWNLTYAMAAPAPDLGRVKTASERGTIYYDDADLADTYEDFKGIELAKNRIEDELHRQEKPVKITFPGPNETAVEIVGGPSFTTKVADNEATAKSLKGLAKDNKVTAKDLAVVAGNPPKLQIAGIAVEADPKDIEKVEQFLRGAKSVDQIRLEARERDDKVTLKALDLLVNRHLRPGGHLRTWPWFEYRGPNPFLLITGGIKHTVPGAAGRSVPWEGLGLFNWFFGEEVPVLLEPLVKFLQPLVYILNPAAGFWNRIYLLVIILWTLATWAVFGGAITRMAAVQVARTNEKVGMTEALRFAWSRIQGYFAAPLLPLIFLGILTVFLILFGVVGTFTGPVGDILVYGLFAPIALLIGLIMAVVLVGLVGWPLMYSTISTEGSDSFDAISRSYSYVYQAPWHYLWYAAVALAYGAVLVFFVGLMGSLMVYLSKWGISLAPGPQSRQPTYLFVYAPTSFGWRDLLLQGNQGIETLPMANPNGTIDLGHAPTAKYWNEMSWNNHLGAILVAAWLYLLFLMIVGFGYSYFWSASTIIYLLMRRQVDDTELDEIHLEEEDLEEPYSAPPATAPTGKAPAQTGPAVTMVEPPTLRPSGAVPKPDTATSPAGMASPPGSVVPPAPGTGTNQGVTGSPAREPHVHATDRPNEGEK